MTKLKDGISDDEMEKISDKAWAMRAQINEIMQSVVDKTKPKEEYTTVKAWEGALMHEALAAKILQLITSCPQLPHKFTRSNELCQHVINQIGEDVTDMICKLTVLQIRIWILEEKENGRF